MATRRGIAEQILRIISGGEPTTEIDISIREIMFLVDQERDSLIKAEILDSMYTKGVANAKGELEILGQYMISKTVKLYGGIKSGSFLYGMLPEGLMSLPKDMAVQHVMSIPYFHGDEVDTDDNMGASNIPSIRQRRVVEVSVDEGFIANTTSELALATFTNGPLKMDDNYIISFTLNTGTSYGEPKEHEISFNVDTKKYKNSIYSWQGLVQAIKNSIDFKKFLKEFKLKITSSDTTNVTASSIAFGGLYNYSFSNFKINSAESGGDHGFTYTVVDLDIFSQDQVSDSSLEVSINNTTYSVDFTNEDWGNAISADGTGTITALAAAQYVAKAFVLKNADKIAKEQNVAVTTKAPVTTYFGQDGEGGPRSLIWFVEMTQRGGFNISVNSPGIITPTIYPNNMYFIAGFDEETGNPNQWGSYNIQGYYPARFKKSKTFTRMPNNGQYNTLYDKAVTMSGRDYYYIHGRTIYLYNKYNTDDLNQITVTFLSNSSYLDDNNPYPIPSDHVNIIIKNVIQILGVMRQAKKDMTNDNLK
tara:strand:+ start:2221 stop:3819 length:1599 start_codon:yes stop_codon:yes gene_type:complete